MTQVKLSVKSPDANQNVYGQNKTVVPLKKEVEKGFHNFHANQLNAGADDNEEQKLSRIQAMKRRSAKAL